MKKKLILIPGLILGILIPTAFAETRTNVSVNTNTGSNTVNGQSVQSTGKTKIIINGKEYVNDDNGGSHDIVDDSNGGRVEVHVNSRKSVSVKQSDDSTQEESDENPEPTIDVKPTIEKKKEEIKQKIEQRRAERLENEDSFFERIGAWFGSLFQSFARD